MTNHIAETSPRLKARIAGLLYLISGTLFVRGMPVLAGDAAATARNILAHPTLFRLGFVAELLSAPCYIAVTLLLYELLRPVSESLALLATVFSVVGSTIAAVDSLLHFAPLVVLGGSHYLSVFSLVQLQALALMFLNLHAQGLNICMVFFGFFCLLLGYLIFKSIFLPRVIGVLLAIAGLCYLINYIATFLWPEFAAHLYPYILIPGLAEIVLALWLLVMGVNVQRWNEQAGAAGGHP
jgi:hypothetical protein